MARGKKASEKIKAMVISSLMKGKSVTESAKEYGIPRATVQGWAIACPELENSNHSSRRTSSSQLVAIGIDSNDLFQEEIAEKYNIPFSTIRGLIGSAKLFSQAKMTKDQVFRDLPIKPDEKGNRFVYLIREDFQDLVKIGIAKNLSSRIASMQTSCPQLLTVVGFFETDSAKHIEKFLHKKFFHKKFRGEWYSLTINDVTELLEYYDMNTL